MPRRTLLAPAVAAVLAAGLAGCGAGPAGSDSTGPVRIAWLGPQTGELATKDRHHALDLAVADVNGRGGAGGRGIEYRAYDSGLTPQLAVTALKKAIADRPAAIIGLNTTAQVRAAAPLIKQAGVPVLHVAQSHTVGRGTLKAAGIFRYGPSNAMQTRALTAYIAREVRPRRVGLISSTDEGSAEATKLIKGDLARLGITDVVERRVPRTAIDLTEAVLAMRGADATITWSFPVVNSLFLRQRRQNGLTAPTFSDNSGSSILGGGLNTPAELAGYHYATACDPDQLDRPQARAYVAAYRARFGDRPTNAQYAQSYDAVQIVAKAVELAGTDDPGKLTEEISTLSYDGVCGVYKADANNDLYHSDLVIDGSGGNAARRLRMRLDGLRDRAP